MDFLKHQNEVVDEISDIDLSLSAKQKNVIVIGGGDTGSDCIGTSNRHKAKSVLNFEIQGKPPKKEQMKTWPYWPFTLKTSSSHEEGIKREWSIMTKEFIGDNNGNLTGLKTVNVSWEKDSNENYKLIEVEGSGKIWPCDLALLALGFTGPENLIFKDLKLK